jgi:hypothetical protein
MKIAVVLIPNQAFEKETPNFSFYWQPACYNTSMKRLLLVFLFALPCIFFLNKVTTVNRYITASIIEQSTPVLLNSFQNPLAQGETSYLPFIGKNLHNPGRTYYVSTTGQDTNPGTIKQPWLTIQKAANTLVAGDTVYIREGTYFPSAPIIPQHSGSAAGGYITYNAFPGENAIIDGSNITNSSALSGIFSIEKPSGRSYIIVENLHFQNGKKTGISASAADHIIISHNTIDNTVSSGIIFTRPVTSPQLYSHDFIIESNTIQHACTGNDQENLTISSGSQYFEVRYNQISHNGGNKQGIDIKGGSHHGSVHDNYIHDFNNVSLYIDAYDGDEHDIDIYNNRIDCNAQGFGIAMSAEQPKGLLHDINVYNNIVTDCTRGSGIQVTNWTTSPGNPTGQKYNILIANNTLVNNNSTNEKNYGGIIVQDLASVTGPIIIENNITSNNGGAGQIAIGNSALSYTDSRNNLIFGNNSSACMNCIYADPRFINPGADDFHLQPSSPAIDAGLTIANISTDYDNIPRPQGNAFDIGAYEYPSLTGKVSIFLNHLVELYLFDLHFPPTPR